MRLDLMLFQEIEKILLETQEKLAAEIVQGKASDYADYRYRVGRLKGIADALAAADEAGKRLIGQ